MNEINYGKQDYDLTRFLRMLYLSRSKPEQIDKDDLKFIHKFNELLSDHSKKFFAKYRKLHRLEILSTSLYEYYKALQEYSKAITNNKIHTLKMSKIEDDLFHKLFMKMASWHCEEFQNPDFQLRFSNLKLSITEAKQAIDRPVKEFAFSKAAELLGEFKERTIKEKYYKFLPLQQRNYTHDDYCENLSQEQMKALNREEKDFQRWILANINNYSERQADSILTLTNVLPFKYSQVEDEDMLMAELRPAIGSEDSDRWITILEDNHNERYPY